MTDAEYARLLPEPVGPDPVLYHCISCKLELGHSDTGNQEAIKHKELGHGVVKIIHNPMR